MGAIVTASGTGSEMNAGAVITNENQKIKCGLFGAQADFAFLDPTYTMSVPFKQIISGAFDTLSHAMETYFGKPDENNISDDFSEAVMRSVIKNMRTLLKNHDDYEARSELMWASSMAENGILKIGKITDFQAHQIEHQLGAYTDCNHGQGLAVIHPVLYRHIYKDGVSRFARFAENVWKIAGNGTAEETAFAGIKALADFIKEVGLPTTFTEMGIPKDTDFKAIADSTNITAGCCKKLTHGGERFEILPVTPYPEEYTPCTEVALEERDSNARPKIKDLPASIDEYDTILIGYPIWWHTAPMIIGTFLENYDLTGIEVYPFTQSASMDEEQFEQSMEFVRGCAGNGNVHNGLFANADDEAAIEEYLKNNGLTD